MTEHQWLTYAEIAERFGISNDGARMLVKRKGWQKKPANYPRGPIRIDVPNDERQPEQPERAFPQGDNPNVPEHSPTEQPPVPERSDQLVTVSAVVSMVSEAVAQERAEHLRREDQLRVDHARQLENRDRQHAAELARISSLHLDLVGRLQTQAAAERSLFLERVDAAELRAEAAEARAAAVDQKLHQVLDRLLERQTASTSTPAASWSWWARWFGHSK